MPIHLLHGRERERNLEPGDDSVVLADLQSQGTRGHPGPFHEQDAMALQHHLFEESVREFDVAFVVRLQDLRGDAGSVERRTEDGERRIAMQGADGGPRQARRHDLDRPIFMTEDVAVARRSGQPSDDLADGEAEGDEVDQVSGAIDARLSMIGLLGGQPGKV
jgi:hypothetical protein